MRTVQIAIVVLAVALASSTNAANFHVTTTGDAFGDGSLANPWDLDTALHHPAAVQPGDTIYVHGGTYAGAHTSLLHGSSNGAPITVRAYRRERVTLDYSSNTNCNPNLTDECSPDNKRCNALTVPTCSHDVVFRDLEIMSSEAGGRVSVPSGGCSQTPQCCYVNGSAPPYKPECGDAPASIARAQWVPVHVMGDNVTLINCVVHDGGSGVVADQTAVDTQIVGSLFFNNGWVDPVKGHGHGQNVENVDPSWRPSTKHVSDTVSWNNFGDGFRSSATWGKSSRNLLLQKLISFNNGAPSAAFYASDPVYSGQQSVRYSNLVIAGDEALAFDTVSGCRTYQPLNTGPIGSRLGVSDAAAGDQYASDLIVENNYFAGAGPGLNLEKWDTVRVTGNTFVGGSTSTAGDQEVVARLRKDRCQGVLQSDYIGYPFYVWGNNAFFFNGSGTTPFLFLDNSGSHYLTFAAWKTSVNRDLNSSYTAALPSANAVFVQPNTYEAGRAHITIYNWQGAGSATANLSTAGLVNGQGYKVYNLQAFNNAGSTDYFGTVVVSGNYNAASPNVSIPMTDATVTAPIGFPYGVASTLPQFGTFLLRATPCGDGALDPGEACDDGNLSNGDGCSVTCQIEPCHNCSGAPSVCSPQLMGTPCDDGLFCNGADTCNASGMCVHPGDPCSGGATCNDACNEAADNCLAAAGSACTNDGNPCTVDQCNGAGTCAHPAGNGGAVCRVAVDVCDVAETCTGGSATCPADQLVPSSIVCRAATGVCDLPESCTGSSASCPNDQFEASTVTCRPAAGDCDVAEQCSGSSAACPANAVQPNGTGCDDQSVCTQVDQCDAAGSCVGSAPLDCDDGNLCTADACDPLAGCQNQGAPATSCKSAQKSSVLFKQRSGDPSKDKLLWKWIRGQATSVAELGDPTAATKYALCVFDGNDQLIASVKVPAGNMRWTTTGTSGYAYRDANYSNDGAKKLILRSGAAGKAKAILKGSGGNLPDPTLGALVLPLKTQLVNGAICLEATFDTGNVVSTSATLFKAKH